VTKTDTCLSYTDGTWLLVWDNVQAQSIIRPYITTKISGASMLVTTRDPVDASLFRFRGTLMNLQKFSLTESHSLFQQLMGTENYDPNVEEEYNAANILLQMLELAL
jgi:hypothetical protein